jgi:hypothetical protein
VDHSDRARHGTLHVEKGEAEGRRQERGLHVHGEQDREPEQDDLLADEEGTEVGFRQDRREDRDNDEADLNPVEEEAP